MSQSLMNVFDLAGTAMSAQSVRLNVTASNLANAQVVSSSPGNAYRARHPVFATALDSLNGEPGGVQMLGIVESDAPIQSRYEPGNPNADVEGNVYLSNVNPVEEMVNMLSASRSYQNSIEVLNTSKELLIRTLNLGQ